MEVHLKVENSPQGHILKPYFCSLRLPSLCFFPNCGEIYIGLPDDPAVKEPGCQGRRHGLDPLGQENPLEEEIATHTSTLAWKIPWTEEHGGLQSMGSNSVGPH